MKVLERRDPRVEFTKQVTCGHCSSKLELEAKDIYCVPSSGGNQHDYCEESFHVTCAVCHKRIGIASSDLPALVADDARNRGRNSGPYDR